MLRRPVEPAGQHRSFKHHTESALNWTFVPERSQCQQVNNKEAWSSGRGLTGGVGSRMRGASVALGLLVANDLSRISLHHPFTSLDLERQPIVRYEKLFVAYNLRSLKGAINSTSKPDNRRTS